MRIGYSEKPSSVTDAIETYSADEVRKFSRLAADVISMKKGSFWVSVHTGEASSQRKADLVPMLVKIMKHAEASEALYSHLTEPEKTAVQEAVSDIHGELDMAVFRAKYGMSPYPAKKEKESESLLPLFICRGVIPPDLKEVLKHFVPKPLMAEPSFAENLPANIIIEAEETTLVRHLTEPAALHDLSALLHLAGNNRLSASSATGYVTGAGASIVHKVLLHGDYYPEGTEVDRYDVQMGEQGIRPFAWCMILQAGKLAKVEGGKLRLTKKGHEALNKSPHMVLKELWESWRGNKLLHEMNRIDIIKGQRSKGNPLYPAEECREQIEIALSYLAQDQWIATDEFFRYLIARGLSFAVARDPWKLYISDREHGSLGYNHITWDHIEGRFARAFLLEYCATLGIIDVALVPPWGAADDMGDLWGADAYSCLSRYDGLKYLRLTPLGAWILGNAVTYSPAASENIHIFTILANLEIAMTSHMPAPDRLFLDRIAERKSERVWELSRSKILQALEANTKFEVIKDFLLSRSGEREIPQPVEVFLGDIKERSEKLSDRGMGRIIECADADTAVRIANDPDLKKLCLPAGDRSLIVPSKNESTFRTALRKKGYVVMTEKTR
jgi:hypothetical protein